MAKIELKNVAHSYAPDVENPEYALKKCNLSWKDGGRYAVLGPSGCGKSTLLAALIYGQSKMKSETIEKEIEM